MMFSTDFVEVRLKRWQTKPMPMYSLSNQMNQPNTFNNRLLPNINKERHTRAENPGGILPAIDSNLWGRVGSSNVLENMPKLPSRHQGYPKR
jgi:hypothetical protein